MKDNNPTLAAFLADVKPTQLLWALQDKKSEDWVVLDSLNYQETEESQSLSSVFCWN